MPIDIYKHSFDIKITDIDGNVIGLYERISDINPVRNASLSSMVQSTIMNYMSTGKLEEIYTKNWSPYEPVKISVKIKV